MAGLRAWLAVAVVVLAVAGCSRDRAVYNVANHPLPSEATKWPLSRIERVVAYAAQDSGWKIEPVQPGLLRGTLAVRAHLAVIDIGVTQRDYSIRLNSSNNLRQTNFSIHPNYNRWVHNLEQAIDRRMGQAALGQELRPERQSEDDED